MGAIFRWIAAALGQLFFERIRAVHAQSLVRTLAVAAERQVPVVPVLEALGDEAGGSWGWKLRKLAGQLSAGAPIPEALDAVPGLLPEEVLATVRVGYDAGRPAEALREAAAYLSRQAESGRQVTGGTLFYLATVALVGSLMLTFIVVWIIPKFKAIFSGFDLSLPPLTEWFLEIVGEIGQHWYLIVLGVMGLATVALVFGGAMSEMLRQGIYWRPRTWLSYLFPRIQTPLVLRCLGLAIDAGRPLPEAVQLVASQTSHQYLKRQLGQFAAQIAASEDCWEILCRSRFITNDERAILSAAADAGNQGWVLRQLAITLENRSSAQMSFLLEFARPLAYLFVGVVVGVVVTSLFLPLVQLIHNLSPEQ